MKKIRRKKENKNKEMKKIRIKKEKKNKKGEIIKGMRKEE